MPEKIPSFEITEEAKLAALLKEKGVENPEAREALINWTRSQEELVVQSKDPDASIKFELKRARLYASSGYIEESMHAYKDAYDIAWNEGRDELATEIENEAKKTWLISFKIKTSVIQTMVSSLESRSSERCFGWPSARIIFVFCPSLSSCCAYLRRETMYR